MVRRGIRLVITAAIAIFIMYLIMVFVMPVELKLGIMMIVLTWIVAVCVLMLWDEVEERNDEEEHSNKTR